MKETKSIKPFNEADNRRINDLTNTLLSEILKQSYKMVEKENAQQPTVIMLNFYHILIEVMNNMMENALRHNMEFAEKLNKDFEKYKKENDDKNNIDVNAS
jgi:hypothetical protein